MELWTKNINVSLDNRYKRFENEFCIVAWSLTSRFADSLGAHDTAAMCSRANLARAFAAYTWNCKWNLIYHSICWYDGDSMSLADQEKHIRRMKWSLFSGTNYSPWYLHTKLQREQPLHTQWPKRRQFLRLGLGWRIHPSRCPRKTSFASFLRDISIKPGMLKLFTCSTFRKLKKKKLKTIRSVIWLRSSWNESHLNWRFFQHIFFWNSTNIS